MVAVVTLGGSNVAVAVAAWHGIAMGHEGWLLAWFGHTVFSRDIMEYWADRIRHHRAEHRREQAAYCMPRYERDAEREERETWQG